MGLLIDINFLELKANFVVDTWGVFYFDKTHQRMSIKSIGGEAECSF